MPDFDLVNNASLQDFHYPLSDEERYIISETTRFSYSMKFIAEYFLKEGAWCAFMSRDIIHMILVQAIVANISLTIHLAVKSDPSYESLSSMEKALLSMFTFALTLCLIGASLLTFLT
jgi:hypothetical protein